MKIGYVRVSKQEQHEALQIDALKEVGCEKWFVDKVTWSKAERKGLDEALAYLRPRDTLMVWKLGNYPKINSLISKFTDTSTLYRLCVVFRDLVDVVTSLLQHRLNLWPSQKARTQRLIPDALRQPLDDPRRLPKRCVRLLLLALCLIHPCQRRLDLPLFAW